MVSVSNSLQALCGFFFLIFAAFIFSENKKSIDWKLIISAFIMLNIVFMLIRYVPFAQHLLSYISEVLLKLLDYSKEGSKFVFGGLIDEQKYGFIFALFVLPTLIFFGALIGVLYFFGIIQWIISILAFCLRKVIKLSGVESLILIADIFLGQSEGPFVIGPYIKSMTRSELALAFTAGLANMSGSTLVMYLTFLSAGDPADSVKFANYLVTASVMNALSAIVFAKLIFPEVDSDNVSTEKISVKMHGGNNLIDSVYQGALTGFKVSATMMAILMAVISLVYMLNGLLTFIGDAIHINTLINQSTNGVFSGLSIQYILGQLFRIFAFFMGINWSETLNVGSLLGQKVALNEFIAYMSLADMKARHILSPQAIYISTFALASFSNFASIGISLGAYSVLAPSRQKELTSLAWKSLYGAVLAGFTTATVAGFWLNIMGQ